MKDKPDNEPGNDYNLDYAVDHQKESPELFGEFKEVLKLYSPVSKEKVLEVGCNTGEFCWLLDKNYDVVVEGIDINAHAIEIAKLNYPDIKFRVMDFFDLEGQYDVIYMQQVIEHIENPDKALIKLKSLLKSGGKLILTCPNHWAYVSKSISWLMNKKFCYDPTHVHEFNPKELVSIVEDSGFKKLKLLTRPGFPFVHSISVDLQYKMPMYLFGDVIFVLAENP